MVFWYGLIDLAISLYDTCWWFGEEGRGEGSIESSPTNALRTVTWTEGAPLDACDGPVPRPTAQWAETGPMYREDHNFHPTGAKYDGIVLTR